MTHRNSTFHNGTRTNLAWVISFDFLALFFFFFFFFFFPSLEVSFSLSALPLNNEELVECENYLERRRHHVQEPITPS